MSFFLEEHVSNSKDSFDLLIVGGGLAGAAFERSMALAGFRVFIIEKELKFRDRIRDRSC